MRAPGSNNRQSAGLGSAPNDGWCARALHSRQKRRPRHRAKRTKWPELSTPRAAPRLTGIRRSPCDRSEFAGFRWARPSRSWGRSVGALAPAAGTRPHPDPASGGRRDCDEVPSAGGGRAPDTATQHEHEFGLKRSERWIADDVQADPAESRVGAPRGGCWRPRARVVGATSWPARLCGCPSGSGVATVKLRGGRRAFVTERGHR